MTQQNRKKIRWPVPLAVAAVTAGVGLFAWSSLGTSCSPSAHADETSVAGAAEKVTQAEPVKGEWPQFRGPNRDGISAEKGLLESWPAEGPKEIWRAPVGEGFSGISISGGRAFTMFNRQEAEWLVAFDAATGRELWELRIDSPYTNRFGDGPRSTPTVDGDTVFALGAQGKLFAAEAATGKTIWSRDLVKEFGAGIPTWGISTAPLVDGKLLLLDVGGNSGQSLVALDKTNGKKVWASGKDLAGYSAPIVFDVAGTRQAVFFTGSKLTAVAPLNGEVLWSRSWKTDYDINAAAPIFVPPNRLFISSGYDVGAALFELVSSKNGWEAVEVWKGRNLKNQFSSSVRVGGQIYGFDDSTLKAIDLETGEDLWRHRGFGHGSLIYADGSLIILGEKGKLVLAEATGEAYREKASWQAFSGKCWTLPTLVDGRLFLRDEKEMISLRVAS
ncbi:MAG: PQQ-binding-like beta-propeller repeat protein [Deltaproteobacteria bacterium]|nr:PQQ-binding-like beta-propeller repeat protein [Deltaproteobacteria bacterium]